MSIRTDSRKTSFEESKFQSTLVGSLVLTFCFLGRFERFSKITLLFGEMVDFSEFPVFGKDIVEVPAYRKKIKMIGN